MKEASVVVLAHLLLLVRCYDVDAEIGIYHGEVLNGNKNTFMASIYINDSFNCGGTYLNSHFVLTAAHCCWRDSNVDNYRVYTNSNYLVNNIKHKVSKIILHNEYNSTISHDNDIALIKIEGTTLFHPSMIQLADETLELQDGDQLDIFGWGRTEYLEQSKKLRHVRVPFFNFDHCEKLYLVTVNVQLTSRMFCAGQLNNRNDACYGDSGGPVFKNNVLVGIVSFGFHCGIVPGVYTKVSYFNSWIKANINEYTDIA